MPPTVKRRTSGVFGGSGRSSITSAPRCSRGSGGAAASSAAKAASCACGRALGEVPGAEVRSQADVGDPTGRLLLHDLDRLVHGAGAVVHPRQQMGVEIDHAAAAPSRSSAAANAPSRSGACWAWARRARVTRASAASRSSATDRSPARASTRSRARPPGAASASRGCCAGAGMGQHALAQGVRRADRLPLQPGSRQAPFPSARVPPAEPGRDELAGGGTRLAVAWWHRPRRRRRSADGRRPCRR